MTVIELIEKLQALPQDAEVAVEDESDGKWKVISADFIGKLVILGVEEDYLLS